MITRDLALGAIAKTTEIGAHDAVYCLRGTSPLGETLDFTFTAIEILQKQQEQRTQQLFVDMGYRMGDGHVVNIATGEEEVDWLKDSPFRTEFLGKVIK